MSLQIHIDDKAVSSLWDGMLRELHPLIASHRVPDEALLEVLRGMFLHILTHLAEDVLVGVADRALRTGEGVLRFQLTRSFKRNFSACALHIVNIGHDDAPVAVNSSAQLM